MDLTEAEDIKKRWQEYTGELYKKKKKTKLHGPYNHNGVITHLVPDILECEVKWDLGNITTNKASGGDGIPVELFQILRQCCESAALNMPTNLEMQQWPQDWKTSVFIPIPKKGNTKKMFKITSQLHSSHILAK